MAPRSPTSRSRALPVLAVGASLLAVASPARGFDAELTADTNASAWQVRGPAGAAVLSLRRLTQTLTLAGATRPDDPRDPVLRVRARLRIDSDFGTSCQPGTDACLDELNASRASEFAPLFARRAVDLPYAYVELAGLGRGAVDLRAGRQLLVDPLGFFLFDGVLARLNVARVASVEAYAGYETRAGFPLSNGRFERDGLLRADRADWDRSLATSVLDRAAAPAVGASLDVHPSSRVEGRFSWRRVWSADGVVEESVAARGAVALGSVARLYAEAVYVVPLATVSLGTAGIEGYPARGGRWTVEVSRVRPVFDLTSIWASFWIDPTDELRAAYSTPVGRGNDLSLAAWGRRYALDAETLPNHPADVAAPYNGGASASFRRRRDRWDLAVRAAFEGGDLGVRGNADAELRAWVVRGVMRVDAMLSFVHVRDALRPDRALDGVGVVAGVMFPLGRIAQLAVSLEDDVNGIVGQRIRAMSVLQLRNIP